MNKYFFVAALLFVALSFFSCTNLVGDDITSPTNDANETPVTETVITEEVKSKEASLSSLSLSVGILKPAFSPSIEEYSATVDTSFETITLDGIATDSKAKCDEKNKEPQTLKDGENNLTFTVTAEDGVTQKTYKILVTREKDEREPEITKFSIDKKVIDTSLNDVNIHGTIIIEDPSGVAYSSNNGSIYIRYPDANIEVLNLVKDENESTFTKCVYLWEATIPKKSIHGIYSIVHYCYKVIDTLGNYNDYDVPLPKGSDTSIEVVGTGDITPPSILSFEKISQSLNADNQIEIKGRIKFEDPSGIQNACGLVLYFGNDIGYDISIHLERNDELSTDTIGVYEWKYTVPENKTTTKVTLYSVDVYDNASNYIGDFCNYPNIKMSFDIDEM